MPDQVKLEDNALWINGKPVVLLCSSLFYFRIPSAYWRKRMRDLKKSGYNAIDVYFPWNYHEVKPGQWDFTGERDVAAFLRIAAEENLFVVARPGPYICSEWDGGGIPIWVHMRTREIRQYDADYLEMFGKWMEHILPVIRDYQLGQGGSIVLVQLENELDLFACRHANRYMRAIRDMADIYGIEVPYVACVAGRGDVDAATGSVERIAPAFNIYPPFSDPSVEEKMEILQKEILMPRGLPLLATETEREHNFMRRELASGVRLISPYCQTATTNFDCHNGVCSWTSTPEKRIVYITGDYDMNAMLKADGAITWEFLEARLLANFVGTMGDAVALGRPFAEHDIRVKTDFRTNDEGVHAMALHGGGWMLCLPNLGYETGTAAVAWNDETFSLCIEGNTTRLLLFDVSLSRWGYPSARILWSALDMAWIGNGELALYGQGDGICLVVNGARMVLTQPQTLTIDGKALHVRLLGREEAARARSPYLEALDQPVLPAWESEPAVVEASCADTSPQPDREDSIQAMERMGAYQGRAQYCFDVPECRELLLENAADIASLWINGKHLRTWISDGSIQRLPVTGGRVSLHTEIWGHTCFDEMHNPLLHMCSLRGLEGAYALLEERDVHNNWRFTPDEGTFGEYVTPVWSALPSLTAFGTLIPKGTMLSGMFRRELHMPDAGDTRMLCFKGITMNAAVYVNGRKIAEVDRSNPYVNISACTVAGRTEEIVIRVRADSCESLPGLLTLCALQRIPKAKIRLSSIAELTDAREITGAPAAFPLALKGGEARWFRLRVKTDEGRELWLRPEGREIMVTVVNNGHVLGRLMPGSEINALFRAGDSQRAWLPHEWLKLDSEVRVRVEALRDGASLDALTLDDRGKERCE